jgi:hypothetical protein
VRATVRRSLQGTVLGPPDHDVLIEQADRDDLGGDQVSSIEASHPAVLHNRIRHVLPQPETGSTTVGTIFSVEVTTMP